MTDESTDSTPSDWAKGPSMMMLIHRIYSTETKGIDKGIGLGKGMECTVRILYDRRAVS